MEALYKRRKVGLADREKRKEFNRQCSKAKKDGIIDSRRRLPLGELNITGEQMAWQIDSYLSAKPYFIVNFLLLTGTSKSPTMKPPKSEVKKVDRLQQLREWQKARKDAQARANAQQKKPVFSFSKQKEVVFRSQISFKKPQGAVTSAAKKAILNLSPSKKPVRPLPVSVSTSKVPVPPSRKPPPQPVANNKIEKTVNKKASAKQIASHAEAPMRKSARLIKSKVPDYATKHAPAPSRGTGKVANNCKKTEMYKNSSRNTRASNAAPSAKLTPKTGKSTSLKMGKQQTKKFVAKAETKKQKPNEKVVPSELNIPVMTMPSSSSQPHRVVTEKEDSLVISIQPTTPIKKSYAPVCPSPLLCSHSADHEQHQKTQHNYHPTFVDEPAWIPGASLQTNTVSENFDNFSSKFSPFKFGAGDAGSTHFHFSFAMDTGLPPEPVELESSLNIISNNNDVTTTIIDRTAESTSEDTTMTSSDSLQSGSISHEEKEEVIAETNGDEEGKMEGTPIRVHTPTRVHSSTRVHSVRKRGSMCSSAKRMSLVVGRERGEEKEITSVVVDLGRVLLEEENEEQGELKSDLAAPTIMYVLSFNLE